MITERDLEQAIAECQGERNPNANTCIKLAAFYTIRHEMFGKAEPSDAPSYSFASASKQAEQTVDHYSETEFSKIIDGRNAAEIWPVMDELMTTLQVLQPRLYDGVMRKLQ